MFFTTCLNPIFLAILHQNSPRSLPSPFLPFHFKPTPHLPPLRGPSHLHPSPHSSFETLEMLPSKIHSYKGKVFSNCKTTLTKFDSFSAEERNWPLCSWQLPLKFSTSPIFWKMKCSTSSMPVVYISASDVSADIVTSHFYWAAHDVIDDICWGWYFKWRLFSELPLLPMALYINSQQQLYLRYKGRLLGWSPQFYPIKSWGFLGGFI